MAFESLSEKISQAFKKLRMHGKLTEKDVKDSMREVRLALLEAVCTVIKSALYLLGIETVESM